MARVTFPIRNFGVYAEYALNRLKDLPLSEVDSRPIRREERTGGGVILELGWRTSAEFGLVRSDWTISDSDTAPTAPSQDRIEEGRQLRVRYKLTGITDLTFDTLNRSVNFVDERQVYRDADERALLPGVEIGSGGILSGALRVGPAHLDAWDPAQPDFSGWIGNARLAWRISSASTLRVEALREVGFAIYQSNPYFVRNSAEARLIHYFNRVFGVDGAAGRGLLTFPESPQAGARTDHLQRLDLGLRFRLLENQLGRRVEYTIGLSRQSRDSTVDTLDQTRNVVAVGASMGF